MFVMYLPRVEVILFENTPELTQREEFRSVDIFSKHTYLQRKC